jgi:hypothetical protein
MKIEINYCQNSILPWFKYILPSGYSVITKKFHTKTENTLEKYVFDETRVEVVGTTEFKVNMINVDLIFFSKLGDQFCELQVPKYWKDYFLLVNAS